MFQNGLELSYKTFTFPAGEVSVKFDFRVSPAHRGGPIKIIARIQNSDDFFRLAQLKDALEQEYAAQRAPKPEINLYAPYLPYGRQDRACDKGESFSLKVFAGLLNSLNFNRVTTCDPHSEVTNACVNNLEVISQLDIIRKRLSYFTNNHYKLISPDAGANKKTMAVAKYFDLSEIVRADKLRDLSNGNIKETIVYYDDFKKADVVCVDDLCDGGRTFTELAKVCKAKNCGYFILYVTHGVFSKGLDTLFENGVDRIITTNSYRTDLQSDWRNDFKKMTVCDISDL